MDSVNSSVMSLMVAITAPALGLVSDSTSRMLHRHTELLCWYLAYLVTVSPSFCAGFWHTMLKVSQGTELVLGISC